jgi:glycosyltransferase involved in cell wall biosynthesis
VEDGVNGFLVPARDAGALAQAARRLVDNPELRRGMGAAARRTADVKFNGAINYRRVLDVCKGCADSTRN